MRSVDLNIDHFWIATSGNGVVGVGGYEKPGSTALIRSFAVARAFRNKGIAREIFDCILRELSDSDIEDLYLLTVGAEAFFNKLGFIEIPRSDTPSSIRMTEQFDAICPSTATLMWRSASGNTTKKPEETASDLFEFGYFCAESVLKTVADQTGIDSPLVPGIATGFCSGISRTCGMCGALTGGILAVNLQYGRDSKTESVAENYRTVQELVGKFEDRCGSTNCKELLGCDLGTDEGQQEYVKKELYTKCAEYSGIAAGIAMQLIKDKDANH